MLAVGVGELWKTLPSIGHDMALVGQEPLHGLLGSLFLGFVVVENELRFEEESDWPNPFGALMVIPTV